MPSDTGQRGQILVLAAAFLLLGTTMLGILFNLSLTVRDKVRLQMAADMAVLSALNVQANGLNSVAMGNRAILAHDAISAQLNALVSQASFYRKLMDRFRRLVRLIPTFGTILSQVMSVGGKTLERLARGITGYLIPAGQALNSLLIRERGLLLATLPIQSLRAARKAVELSSSGGRIWLPTQASLLRQARSVVRSLLPLKDIEVKRLIRGTVNPRTMRRNWDMRLGKLSLPLRKRGGTTIHPSDFRAHDVLRMKVLRRFRWRWRTVLSAESRASKFGYRSHGRILDMSSEGPPLSLTLVLKSARPEPSGGIPGPLPAITAASSGEIFYHRPGRPEEHPNTLNPFWRTRLIPVSDDPMAMRVLPRPLLKEIRH